VKEVLKDKGIDAQSFTGHLMFEPWTVETGQGGFYKVYTPFWKAVCDRDVPAPLSSPSDLKAPATWPDSETLADWNLGQGMRRGADVVRPYVRLGEQAAQTRLGVFMRDQVADYGTTRDEV